MENLVSKNHKNRISVTLVMWFYLQTMFVLLMPIKDYIYSHSSHFYVCNHRNQTFYHYLNKYSIMLVFFNLLNSRDILMGIHLDGSFLQNRGLEIIRLL